MKQRTKSGLLTVLLALVFALTLCAGLCLAMPKSSNNASAETETGLVPLYGTELAQNPSGQAHDTTGGDGTAVFWDFNHTQMRIHFKYVGDAAPSRPGTDKLGKCVKELGKYILLTKDGQTKSLVEWAWGWYSPATVNDNGTYEIWINAGSENLNAVTEVTILAGLTWQDTESTGGTPQDYSATPVAGAVVHKNYTLRVNSDKTNYELVSDSDPVGVVPLTDEAFTACFADGSAGGGEYQGKKNVWWDATQMRIYFRLSGVYPLPTPYSANDHRYTHSSDILIKAGGEEKTAAAWMADEPDNLREIDILGHGEGGASPDRTSVYEIWINGEPNWLKTVETVTIKQGFQWIGENKQPVAGLVAPKTFVIENKGDAGWHLVSATDEPLDDKSITPLGVDGITGHFLNSDKQTAPNVFWDNPPSQMRFYFKLNNVSAPAQSFGSNIYDGEENILLTTKEGETHSVKDWAAVMNGYWMDNSRTGPQSEEYHEVWLCTQNHDWFNSLGYVTIKAGFQLKSAANTPVPGAVVKETVYLRINENGQYETCTEQDIPKQPEQEVTFSPLTAAEAQGHFKVSGDANAPYAGKLGSYWGITQMRFYFKATGLNLTGQNPGTTVYNQSDKILLTDANNDTKSVKDWGSEKIAWIDFWPTPNSGAQMGYGEIDLCIAQGTGQPGDHLYDTNTVWLEGIKKVTFKAGFEWLTAANTPVAGTALKEDVVLWNGGIDAGWQRYADRITAALTEGEIEQGARLEDHLTVTAHYGEEEEAVTGYTLEGYDPTKGGEAQTVTVKYQDKDTTVSVTLKAAEKTLTGIELSGTTTFTVPRYEELNTEGLIVTAKFDDESEQIIEAGNYTVEAFDPWTTQDSVTLKVSYKYAGETCEANITVNVTDPDTTKGLKAYAGYEIYWNNNLTLYFKFEGITAPSIFGNAFAINNFPGNHIVDYLVFKMKDGTEQSYRDWKEGHSDWIAASEDKSHVGAEWAKICINLSGATAEATFAQLQSITIKAGFQWVGVREGQIGSAWGTEEDAKYQNWPGAVVKEDFILWKGDQSMATGKWQKGATSISATYNGGEITVGGRIDRSQLTVTATYYDSTTADVTDYTLDERALSEAGNGKTVTVTYQDKTATFTVNVKAAGKSVTDIALSSETVNAKQFEKPDLSNIKVNVTYSDSTTASVGLDDQRVALSAYDTETMGDKQITVTYEEFGQSFQKTLTLKVGDPDLSKGLEFVYGSTDTRWIDGAGHADYVNSTQLRLHFQVVGLEGTGLTLGAGETNIDQTRYGDPIACYAASQHIKDYVIINGETFAQYGSRVSWMAVGVAQPNLGGGVIEFWLCILEDGSVKEANLAWLNGINTIELKAGFRIADVNGDVEGLILKKDVQIWNTKSSAGWEKKVTNLNASSTQVPAIGDEVDLGAITASLTYFDGTSAPLTVTADMIDKTTFEEGGEQKVTVTYQDQHVEIRYQVSNQRVTKIEIESEPTRKTYRFGTLHLDLAGLVVNKVFADGTKEKITNLTEENFDYDPYCTEKTQTVTVTYGTFTASFVITMEPLDRGVEIVWNGGASFDSAVNVEGLTVVLSMTDIQEPKAVQVPFNAPGVIDKLMINGKPAQEYVDKGLIDWIGFYSWRFIIAFHTKDLVWGTESGNLNPNSSYEAGRSELVRTIQFLPGFQVYTSNDGKDHYGASRGEDPISMSYLQAMEGVVVTENVLLYNRDGHGWDRVLKQGEGSNLDGSSENFKLVPAADAITLKSSGKVTYKKGENFSIQGFTFTLKFEDGGTQDLSLRRDDVDPDSFDPNTLGEQNVIIEIAGGTYTLKVTVTEDGQGGGQPGGDQPGGDQPGEQGGEEEGGCGGILGVNALMLMGGACAVALLRKRRK